MSYEKDWEKKYDAPPGQVWVCGACGKMANNRSSGGRSYGWDVSCFLHAVLCHDVPQAGTEEHPWRPVDELQAQED